MNFYKNIEVQGKDNLSNIIDICVSGSTVSAILNNIVYLNIKYICV